MLCQQKILLLYEALSSLLDSSSNADSKNKYLQSYISKIAFSRENKDGFILNLYFQRHRAVIGAHDRFINLRIRHFFLHPV